MTKLMKFVQVIKNENRITLTISAMQKPVPRSHEVLIKIMAAGVNRADILQKNGKYPPPSGVSEILGLEVSGVIEACGDLVQNWEKNDKVLALLDGGGYAEYVCVDAKRLLPIIKHHSFVEAAAIPEALYTIYNNLFNIAKINLKKTLLVHAGASGIGTMAIQIAKIFGIKIFTTTTNNSKIMPLLSLGADFAINTKSEDFSAVCKKATNNRGVDIILDAIGASILEKNLDCLSQNGCLISIGLMGGYKTHLNMLPILQKNLTITGTTLRDKSDNFKAKLTKQIVKKIWPLLIQNNFKPVIHKVLPITRANEAHQIMESNENIGKIILQL